MEYIYNETISICKEKNRAFLLGKLINDFNSVVSIKDRNAFFDIFFNSPNAILIIDKKVNALSVDEIDLIDEKLSSKFSEEIEVVKTNISKTHTIKLYFSLDNFIIQHICKSNWRTEYRLVKSIVNDPDSIAETFTETEMVKKRMTDEEKKRIVEDILKDSRFNSYLTPIQISQLITLIFDEKSYTGWEYNSLKYVIEARYNNNIKPEHEKILRSKIQELKNRKMTKTSICSELNIGITLLNKYF